MTNQPEVCHPANALLHTVPLFPMDPTNGIVDCAVRLVNVPYSAIPHTPRLGHVFCPRGIVMGLIQQFQCLAESAIGTHVGIDRRVIGKILAIVDRGALDLVDRCIDFADRVFFIPLNRRPGDLIQVSASEAQVG